MTLAQPAAATLTINGLINKVQAALQNRPDVSETQTNPEMRPSAWIRDTLRELTANWPFTELQIAGPLTTIGPGLGYQGSNYMYPVSMFLNPGDDMTSSEDPAIFLTPQQQQAAIMQGATASKFVGTATGTVCYPMDFLTVKAIQPMLFIPGGIPFRYTRYGNMFWFGTQPGTNYSVYLGWRSDGGIRSIPLGNLAHLFAVKNGWTSQGMKWQKRRRAHVAMERSSELHSPTAVR